MTYDQYWNDDCQLVKFYRKAHKLKNEQKNQELWLQGMYIYEALCNVPCYFTHLLSEEPDLFLIPRNLILLQKKK